MIAAATSASAGTSGGGHPLWHLLVVAGAAIGLFVAITVKEHCERRRARRAPRPTFTPPTMPVVVLAVLSAAAGALHASVSGEHFQEAFVFGMFFLMSSTLQAGWAVAVVYRPSRPLLRIGVYANAATIALWAVSRTVGLPIGPQHWHPEAIGTVDVVCTLVEVALIFGALGLLARNVPLTTPDTVASRLETLRAQHPTLVRDPGAWRATARDA